MNMFRKRFHDSISKFFPHTHVLKQYGLLTEADNYLGLTQKGLAFEDLVLKTYCRKT